jgi:hypothetical protein
LTWATWATWAKLIWRGEWNSWTPYSIDNLVEFNGSTFICVVANTNQQPPINPNDPNPYRELVAIKWATGPQWPQWPAGWPTGATGAGSTGATGPQWPAGNWATGATGATWPQWVPGPTISEFAQAHMNVSRSFVVPPAWAASLQLSYDYARGWSAWMIPAWPAYNYLQCNVTWVYDCGMITRMRTSGDVTACRAFFTVTDGAGTPDFTRSGFVDLKGEDKNTSPWTQQRTVTCSGNAMIVLNAGERVYCFARADTIWAGWTVVVEDQNIFPSIFWLFAGSSFYIRRVF